MKISQNCIKILKIGLVGRNMSLTSYQNLYAKSCTRLYKVCVRVCAQERGGVCVFVRVLVVFVRVGV